MKKVLFKSLFVVLSLVLVLPAPVMADQDKDESRWVIDDVILGDIVPFAIGHRGYGVNLGEIPDNPIENTKKAVRRSFREGIMIVEVDANLTADNIAVALHDDYLSDLTCINTLTFDELKEILPDASSLKQILKASQRYSVMTESDRPSGQVVVEIKTPTPFCVPLEEEQGALQALVDAVLDDIRFTQMVDQVTIESFSPEILDLVKDPESGEPNIPRMLAVDVLQLLPLEMIGPMSGYEYTVQSIEKDSFDLAWGEVGVELAPGYPVIWFFRVPSYFTTEPGGALGNYIRVLGETGSSIASLDKQVLFMAESQPETSAAAVVGVLHSFGFPVLVFTIDNELEWGFMSLAGVDGMYVDDIPMGLTMEGP
jgi:glycerophosphoryl diester phosphodiesterase